MRLHMSFLLLVVLLVTGVVAAASQHGDGLWVAVPAAIVLAVAAWRGRVSWVPMALALPLIALVIVADRIDPHGWHTLVPVAALALRLYALPWGKGDDESPIPLGRDLVIVGLPVLAMLAFGITEAETLGRHSGGYPALVWLLCAGLLVTPLRRPGHRAWAYLALIFVVLAPGAGLQWGVAAGKHEKKCLEAEAWAMQFLHEIAQAQAKLAEANRDLADILDSVDARSPSGVDVLGPTATVSPRPFDPRSIGLDRDRDGIGEHPTLAELAGDVRSPARHTRLFDVVRHGDIMRVRQAEGLALYRGRGYYFLSYLNDGDGNWTPEHLPERFVGIDGHLRFPPREEETPELDADDLDARERGVLTYGWPVHGGLTGRRTFLIGSEDTVLATDASRPGGYGGLARRPAPPVGLDASGQPATNGHAPMGELWRKATPR